MIQYFKRVLFCSIAISLIATCTGCRVTTSPLFRIEMVEAGKAPAKRKSNRNASSRLSEVERTGYQDPGPIQNQKAEGLDLLGMANQQSANMANMTPKPSSSRSKTAVQDSTGGIPERLNADQLADRFQPNGQPATPTAAAQHQSGAQTPRTRRQVRQARAQDESVRVIRPGESILPGPVQEKESFPPLQHGGYRLSDEPSMHRQFLDSPKQTATERALQYLEKIRQLEFELRAADQRNQMLRQEFQLTVNSLNEATEAIDYLKKQLDVTRKENQMLRDELKKINMRDYESTDRANEMLKRLKQAISGDQVGASGMETLPNPNRGNQP